MIRGDLATLVVDPRDVQKIDSMANEERSNDPQTTSTYGTTNPPYSKVHEFEQKLIHAGESALEGSALDQDASLVSKEPTSYAKKTIASTFEGAHHFTISGNPSIVNIGEQNVKTVEVNYYGYDLDILKPFVSFDALHDSSVQDPERRCHPGTRETILKQMRKWIDDPDMAERILWLHGPVGVGKSAIAQTISHLYGRDKIAGTFFFFRSDPARNDGNHLFPTLAWQLARSIPELKQHIIHSLDENPDLPRKAIEIQFEQLILRPLQDLFNIMPQLQAQMRVIVIDGVDECLNEQLQRRFLKIIGSAVTDTRFPLRFVISSRPEEHIQEAFDPFLPTTLRIDLADIDQSYHDIEKYLTDELHRIASENQLDALEWPGERIVNDLVHQSSGQFVYASTIVKFVGDKYSSATTQLAIIIGLEPTDGESPFANLDALYLEILQRQPHQGFLKGFLALLIGRSGIPADEKLGKDDPLLLNISENVLRKKLRGMHSLLKFKPQIGVHHNSFLEFMKDASRSTQYHISQCSGTRRYLELITDTLVRYASRVIKQPDYHGADHFQPEFRLLTKYYPRKIELPLNDWEEVLKPLFGIQNSFLKINSVRELEICKECAIFDLVNGLLLHLMFFRTALHPTSSSSHYHSPASDWAEKVGEHFISPAEGQSLQQTGIDRCLSSLLACLRSINLAEPRATMTAIDLLGPLLQFDPRDTAARIGFTPDAQALMDFVFYVAGNRRLLRFWDTKSRRNAAQLALDIYARVPLLPRPFLLNAGDFGVDGMTNTSRVLKLEYQGKVVIMRKISWGGVPIRVMFEQALVPGILLHNSIISSIGIYEGCPGTILHVFPSPENGTLIKWRRTSDRSVAEIIPRMLDVAKALQYLHSLAVRLHSRTFEENVLVDSGFHVKLLVHDCFLLNGPTAFDVNVSTFGCFFGRILFDLNSTPEHRYSLCEVIQSHPHKSKVPDTVLKLLLRCSENVLKSMDEVVAEMEKLRGRQGGAGLAAALVTTFSNMVGGLNYNP